MREVIQCQVLLKNTKAVMFCVFHQVLEVIKGTQESQDPQRSAGARLPLIPASGSQMILMFDFW